MTNPRLLASLLTALIATTACADKGPPQPVHSKVIPGNPAASAASIPAHRIRYEKSGGAMNYHARPVTLDGETLWQIDIDFDQGEGGIIDRMWLDADSMAYRKRLLAMPAYTIDVQMRDGLFSGTLTPSERSEMTPVDYNRSYPHDAYEPAIINYAIATLPLKLGYTASIPVIDLNNGSQMFWSNIRVTEEDTLKIDGQKFDTWKVVSDGIRKKTIWISKQHGFAIKMKTSGNFGSWKIVPDSIELN